MWSFYLCLLLYFSSSGVNSQESNNNTLDKKSLTNEDDESNGSLFDIFSTNNSVININKTIETQRITQPLAQTQQIERTIPSPVTNVQNKSVSTTSSLLNFKPSPHLETYYEYNKVPVIPAFPEAKHISNLNLGEYQRRPQWPQHSFTTTEQSWTSRVKFPAPSVPTVRDRPYQFYNEDKKFDNGNFPTKSNTGYAGTISNVWDERYQNHKKTGHHQQFDFQAPVQIPSKHSFNSHGEGLLHGNNYDFSLAEKPHQDMQHQGNPWKKIIKFLTAFIPIGLLISALTPTVITVSNVNGTQTRSRADDAAANKNSNHIVSSLSNFGSLMGCEDRIFCELLVSASTSKNAEQHVKNLLNTFIENGKAVERADELKQIFDAVKKEDCSPILCKNIKENT